MDNEEDKKLVEPKDEKEPSSIPWKAVLKDAVFNKVPISIRKFKWPYSMTGVSTGDGKIDSSDMKESEKVLIERLHQIEGVAHETWIQPYTIVITVPNIYYNTKDLRRISEAVAKTALKWQEENEFWGKMIDS